MVDSPDSKCTAYVCQIYVQKGAKEVTDFLASIKVDGELPPGLRGARMVFPASDNNAPDACLDPIFHEGLAELEKAGLHWEFVSVPAWIFHFM